MKGFLRCLIPALTVLAFGFVLAGCRVGHYSESEMKRVIEDGRPYLEQYVKSLPVEAELKECYMLDGYDQGATIYGNYYLSKCVRGDFKVGEQIYHAVVNMEDMRIYSDLYTFNLCEAIEKQMRPYADKYGFTGEFTISEAVFNPLLHSHIADDGKGREKDVVSYMEGVIPAEFTETDPEKQAEQVLKNAEISGFYVEFLLEDGVFDTRILTDYLRESGNYVKEADRNLNQFYRIRAMRSAKEVKDGDLYSYDAEMDYEGDLENMVVSEMSMICKEENEFTVLYQNMERTVTVKDLESTEPEIRENPFGQNANTLTFTQEISPDGILFFREKPEYTKITGTFYHYEQKPGNPQSYAPGEDVELKPRETVSLELHEEKNGFYYLRRVGATSNVSYDDPKIEIVFEK